MRLMDAVSRVSPCKGFGARHHSMRIAAEIEWRPGLPIATWVFAGRGGGGFGARWRIEWRLGFERHDARRGSLGTRLGRCRPWTMLRGSWKRHIQEDDGATREKMGVSFSSTTPLGLYPLYM